jgi:DNA-directed RNA polymerase subunit L
MIELEIREARIKESFSNPISYYVEHPCNDAILAYCDTEEEAERVREELNRVANLLENKS